MPARCNAARGWLGKSPPEADYCKANYRNIAAGALPLSLLGELNGSHYR